MSKRKKIEEIFSQSEESNTEEVIEKEKYDCSDQEDITELDEDEIIYELQCTVEGQQKYIQTLKFKLNQQIANVADLKKRLKDFKEKK